MRASPLLLLRLAALAPLGLSPIGPAVAAGCEGPRVYEAHYQEQICTRGAAGYATCRWVSRVHEVTAPGDCAPDLTEERSRPADRGADARRRGAPLGG